MYIAVHEISKLYSGSNKKKTSCHSALTKFMSSLAAI